MVQTDKDLQMRFMVLLAALALMACNTVQGVGRDIESIGKKSEDVIND